jgi:membrane protease YdiL (CAAX protease family)
MNWKPNWKLAVVISALLFSIAHLNPAQMPHAFLLGLLLGWVFVRTGSVVPGIIIHGVNNLTVYIIASSVPGIEDMSLADLYGGSEMKALLSVAFSLLILLPALFQLHLNMKKE